ncbi:ABC transporter ATP-binding protein [Castellaniella sp.]|uniref:ABC transporter ATP-binding protein n=1 Tax=Castellaniella sp. TaxID=1955812 RepID=UPI002B0039C2|nr:ABC transporter ATP-binding protein [Castellaniella sp.]
MTAKLETRGLCKRYGETTALASTDLEVRDGEFLTLLGPSGSGKTTLLQMISGLVAPSEGALFIDGRDATRMSPGKRGIGLVFQSYALFPHLTVSENVAYPLRMRRVGGQEIARRVVEALAMVRMEEFGERYPRELSGGQQQRVALARCFVYRPSVVLLDEPLGALDKKLREHMQLEIRRLHKELGATFIYVTHDQEEALTMSDRICLMNRARIEQLGTPLELYDRPVSRFAADFLGHSNILEGRASGDGHLHWAGGALPLPSDGPVPAPGEAAILVRPESARLCPPGPQAFFSGTVVQVVFTGADMRVMVDPGDGSEFLVRAARRAAPCQGALVGVRWDRQEAVLLRR